MGLLEQLDAVFKAVIETSTKLSQKQMATELTSGRRGGARMSFPEQLDAIFKAVIETETV